MYIYKTTNIDNGMIYIGLSLKSPENSRDYFGSGHLIKNAISKHGCKKFTKEILEEGFTSRKDLCDAEIRWIKHYDSTNPKIGYNLSEGGDLNNDHVPRTFYQYDRNGILIKTYPDVASAIEGVNSKNTDLRKVKYRETKPIKGFWWSTEPMTQEEVINKESVYSKTKKENLSNAGKERYKDPIYYEERANHMRNIQKMVKNFTIKEETKEKLAKAIRGRHWYTNLTTGETKQAFECPDGFTRGRMKIDNNE
jgi:hypothetical protein